MMNKVFFVNNMVLRLWVLEGVVEVTFCQVLEHTVNEKRKVTKGVYTVRELASVVWPYTMIDIVLKERLL